jgi:probable rRNA maturation factor
MISFESELSKTPFDGGFPERFKGAASSFSEFLKDDNSNKFTALYKISPFFSFNVTLCDDKRMQELNRDYRGKDKTTDVLTLALYDDIRSGEEMLFEEVELGDIFISAPVMTEQAKEFKVTIEQEFFHLMVHGFLHLLGFDHEISEQEEVLMEKMEKRLVDDIYANIYKKG